MSVMTPTKRTKEAAPRMFKPPQWEYHQTADVGWWIRGVSPDLLIDENGLRLEQWRDEGRVETIKSGPHRIVYRVQLPEFAIYIKHYLVPDRRAKYRQWFRRGKGRNEGKRSENLKSIGVPTISPIALGERRKRKFLFDNYLITREIPDSIPMDTFVEEHLGEYPEPRRSRIRRRLAKALGVLTARLHNAGLVHIDFHPGNVLVRIDAHDNPVLVMIDLDALRTVKDLSWTDAERNVALLDHYFWTRAARTDRRRFVQSYLDHRGEKPPSARAFAEGVEASTRRWAERLWRRWGKRCRTTNKYFEVHKSPRAWCVASRDLDPSEIAPLLDDPDAPLSRPDARLIKDSRTTLLIETKMIVGGEPVPVIFKRFNRRKWIDPILSMFRPSSAWRSWQAGQHLMCRGLPTPKNLAYIARRRRPRFSPLPGMLAHETYVITVKQENATTLARHIRDVMPQLSSAERRAEARRLTLALAALIRKLHDRSLSHRDLKASNILVDNDRSLDEGFLHLIDLVGVRLQNPLPMSRRIQNLSRLNVSLTDAPGRSRSETLRFLRAYLPGGLSRSSGWKDLWRAVDKASLAKRDLNLRRGRPLS